MAIFWSILANFFEFFDHLVRKIEKLVFFYVLSVPKLPGKKCYLLFIASPKGRFNFNGFFLVLVHCGIEGSVGRAKFWFFTKLKLPRLIYQENMKKQESQ